MRGDISNPDGSIEVPPEKPRVGKIAWWVKVLLAFGCLLAMVCGGGFLFLIYLGVMAPATYVYPSAQIPQRFLTAAEEVGDLQPGEEVEFFYSSGFIDVREGFTYVSDRKVVIYVPDGEPPLVTTAYPDIQGLEFERDESFLGDSMITVETEESYIVIPVSSEMDRDVEFYEAIRSRVRLAP